MSRSSARWLITLALAAIAILVAAPASFEAEDNGAYSDASLNGTFVFRARGSSLFTLPGELTSNPVYLASIGFGLV